MGNHTAGALIGMAVDLMIAKRKPHDSAIELLDRAVDTAKTKSGFSLDVEFDDEINSDTPFGRLIFEAFAPNGIADIEEYDRLNEDGDDDAFDALYEATYGAFHKRYGFC